MAALHLATTHNGQFATKARVVRPAMFAPENVRDDRMNTFWCNMEGSGSERDASTHGSKRSHANSNAYTSAAMHFVSRQKNAYEILEHHVFQLLVEPVEIRSFGGIELAFAPQFGQKKLRRLLVLWR
jgi:hypothetical protein